MGRWSAPARPVVTDRRKVPGLGGQATEVVEGEDKVVSARALASAEREGGFTGIRSRSRFLGLIEFPVIGHGGAQNRDTGPTVPDPAAGESQFEREPSLVDTILRTVFTNGLGTDDRDLTRSGALRYVRDRVPVDVTGTRVKDPPRFSDAGPVPRAFLSRVFTMRREFMQDAQSFLGTHQAFGHAAPGSRSPVRMAPARTNRLTVRRLPASFGATTEVVD